MPAVSIAGENRLRQKRIARLTLRFTSFFSSISVPAIQGFSPVTKVIRQVLPLFTHHAIRFNLHW